MVCLTLVKRAVFKVLIRYEAWFSGERGPFGSIYTWLIAVC